MGKVLADAGLALPRVRGVGGDLGGTFDISNVLVQEGADGQGVVRRRRRVGSDRCQLGEQGGRWRHPVRDLQELAPLVLHGVERFPRPPLGLGLGRVGLDDRRGHDGELDVRLVDLERRDRGSPVVAVLRRPRRGRDLEPGTQHHLVGRGEWRHAGLVERGDRAGLVAVARDVLDPELHAHKTTPPVHS